MTTAIRRSITPADPVQARIFEPVSKLNGITLIKNGVIYSFDDWDGTNILTQNGSGILKPIPYKNSLSNVFTGFEIVGWEGNGVFKNINLNQTGLTWAKSRDTATANLLTDVQLGETYWVSNSDAVVAGEDISVFKGFTRNQLRIGSDATINKLNDSVISWNWDYPLAKAWHANGGSSRKVPTPWGIVDSVESNSNSGLSGDQVAIEVYNPLTGNGCLLYIGTGANRTLDISGGVAPEFLIVKNLTQAARQASTFHSSFNGGTTPENYYIDLNSNSVEAVGATYWNNTAPTQDNISLGGVGFTNETSQLMILYYFSPIAGLQNFGGYTGNSGINNQATGCKDGIFFTKKRSTAIAGTGNWLVYDSFRGNSKALQFDNTATESTIATLSFNSTSGIDINSAGNSLNLNNEGYIYSHFGEEIVPQDNFDVYPTNSVQSSGSNNKTKITFEYKGSASLNSEILLYSSRKAATIDWVLGSMQKTADLSDGYEQIEAEIDISSVVNDDEMRWRLASNESPLTEHNIKNLKMVWYS